MNTLAHAKIITQLYDELQASEDGLASNEVVKRIKREGQNVLPTNKSYLSTTKIFFSQWKSPLLLILLVAGAVSGFLGELIDMTVIFITAGINALIGFFQENKANNALKKLSKLIQYDALLLRDGKKKLIPSTEIVAGDILYLEAGDKVQADGRIISCTSFEVNEAPLTGEVEPIKKNPKKISEKASLGDRTNMVYRGTTIMNGTAVVLVTAIGKNTELGSIATLVKETADDETPLQLQLKKLSKKLGLIVILMAVVIFVVGTFFGKDTTPLHMFETAVAVAVAAVPEGLVISLTVILAIGMRFILKKKALVRKLVAAETLGSVSVICTDKTGTITEGRMGFVRLISDCTEFDLTKADIDVDSSDNEDLRLALRVGSLCNDAALSERETGTVYVGDSTDIAFIQKGEQLGLRKQALDDVYHRIDAIPFDSERKYMATLNVVDAVRHIYIKGAPEVLIKKCTSFVCNGKTKKLTKKEKDFFINKIEELSLEGFRLILLGRKKVKETKNKVADRDLSSLELIGIAVLADPLRKDVAQTIKKAEEAGIRTIMITGDHVNTAMSIAKQVGLPFDKKYVFDGAKLSKISDEKLQDVVLDARIFARVDPIHKIRIVQALQANGHVVAMTGDGVNDAPAIKGADIGIALGSGTDVAKETADMVLLDDSFATIVSSVEEGRGIYQNIKKVVLYLLSGSFAEVILILGSILAGMPVAALPAQILWINIIEDSFPNIALAFDKGDKENMQDPPRDRSEGIIDKEMKTMIILKSIFANVVLFGLFVYFYQTTGDIALTRTIVFVGFAVDSLFYIFSIRSLRHMVWQSSPFSNVYLLLAVGFGWLMLISAIYVPQLQLLLRTVPLEPQHWIIMLAFGLFNLVLIEAIKFIFIIRQHKKQLV
jgi:P-type Ca2+ transporter type 2C